MNTVVDYGLFNLLAFGLGVTPVLTLFGHEFDPLLVPQVVGVSAGIANSYLWNKLWTFRSRGWQRWRREVLSFLVISGLGFLINVLGFLLLRYLHPSDYWVTANATKLAASLLSLTWNFLGYRFVAFRPSAAGGGS